MLLRVEREFLAPSLGRGRGRGRGDGFRPLRLGGVEYVIHVSAVFRCAACRLFVVVALGEAKTRAERQQKARRVPLVGAGMGLRRTLSQYCR